MCMGLENVDKAFGAVNVLHQFSFSLPKGKVTALLGPSGAGKTTLLRLLAGLDRPDHGKVLGKESHKISVLFQENRLLEYLTVKENWDLVTEHKAQMEPMAAILGLSDLLYTPVEHLSGGEKRRAALGRLLCHDGEVLLLDEPFTGVDAVRRDWLMEQLKDILWNKTVLLITHDMTEALALAHQVLVVSGRPLKQQAVFSLAQPLSPKEQMELEQRIRRKMECDF